MKWAILSFGGLLLLFYLKIKVRSMGKVHLKFAEFLIHSLYWEACSLETVKIKYPQNKAKVMDLHKNLKRWIPKILVNEGLENASFPWVFTCDSVSFTLTLTDRPQCHQQWQWA